MFYRLLGDYITGINRNSVALVQNSTLSGKNLTNIENGSYKM